MEHLSFASYLAEDLRMNETWTWTGNSRGVNTQTQHSSLCTLSRYIREYDALQDRNHTFHGTDGSAGFVLQKWFSKVQRRGGQALRDDSKFSSKGSGGRVFLVHPRDRAQSKTWRLETTGVLAGQKVAVGPWGADSKWTDAQGSLSFMHLDEHLVVLYPSVLSCVWLLATPWTEACQVPLFMGILQARIGGLPDPGIKPISLASPALAGRFSTTELPGKPCYEYLTERQNLANKHISQESCRSRLDYHSVLLTKELKAFNPWRTPSLPFVL